MLSRLNLLESGWFGERETEGLLSGLTGGA
jgi:hypothetical protein